MLSWTKVSDGKGGRMKSKEGREKWEWEGRREGGRGEEGREGGRRERWGSLMVWPVARFLQINLHKLYDKNFQVRFFPVQFACVSASFSVYKLITFTL